ncbi:MAG: hypothetical protein AAF547_11920 [Actinomycetota bacterium]
MTDPRIPPDLLGHEVARAARAASDHQGPDPVGWCVIATTALLAWLLGPVALAVLGAIGLVRYGLAWRRGRMDSRCILGDVRVVIGYLAVLTTVGIVATALRFF